MHRNGCFDRPDLLPVATVQDGYRTKYEGDVTTRIPVMVNISFKNTTECQYSRHYPDAGCDGCRHRQELEVTE